MTFSHTEISLGWKVSINGPWFWVNDSLCPIRWRPCSAFAKWHLVLSPTQMASCFAGLEVLIGCLAQANNTCVLF